MSNVAIYMRVSVEEKETEESGSIGNQRIYLREFVAKDNELKTKGIKEYLDDGYSGTSVERPGFQEMMKDLKNGVIDSIVVKDLSRFSRDYITLGDYLENIFPFMQIRFIAINDGYDSSKCKGNGTELDVQFKGLLYDFYTKDCSKKIKSVQNQQKASGKFLGWQPPYGYIKDPENKHQIIPDEETAPIVKEIYEMSLNGMSARKIAKELTERGIKTPGQRKKETSGYDFTKRVVTTDTQKNPSWPHGTVIDILANETYIGTYVYNSYENKTVGSRSTRKSDKSKWCRVYNHHEPIISKEVFDKVQKAKAKRSFNYKRNDDDFYKKTPIQGLVKCKECGHIYTVMGRAKKLKRTGETARYFYFRCRTCKIRGNEKHVTLRVDKYEKLIYKELKRHIGEERIKYELEKEENTLSVDYKSEMKRIEKKLEKLNTKKRKALEQYKFGKMDRDKFMSLKDSIELEKEELKEQFKEYEKELRNEVEAKEKTKDKKEDVFTRELVEKYIEEILIDRHGNMEIKFKN
ncbi:MAG: recombinase family protein [Christensenellales bacterium]|jgi:site-specific DNA recombinase